MIVHSTGLLDSRDHWTNLIKSIIVRIQVHDQRVVLSTKWTDLHEVISADTINNGGVNQDGVLPPIVNHSCQLVHSHQNGKPKECKNVTLSHIFPAGGCYLAHLTQSMSIVQVGLPHDQSDQSKQCLQNRN